MPRKRLEGRSPVWRGHGGQAQQRQIVPLLNAAYVDQLRRYLATFRPGRRRPLFDASRKTAWLLAPAGSCQCKRGRD